MTNLVQAAQSGIETGMAIGGRLSGFGKALKGIAAKLRGTRETEEAIGVLGRTERVKAQIKKEYEPTTQPIVSRIGEVVGTRPVGAVFAPEAPDVSNVFEENIKNKVAQGKPLTKEQMDYYNKFLISGQLREPFEMREPKKPKVSLFKGLFGKKKSAEERFNELIQSMSEDEAYQQLKEEGF